jgi:hypothetical protein
MVHALAVFSLIWWQNIVIVIIIIIIIHWCFHQGLSLSSLSSQNHSYVHMNTLFYSILYIFILHALNDILLLSIPYVTNTYPHHCILNIAYFLGVFQK